MVKNSNAIKYWSGLEGWVSIFTNLLLAALKYWAGIVSGSIALIADAWHTLSDTVSSIIVIVGSVFSSRPADKEHPFGHGRAELISTFIISVILFIVAFFFLKESVTKLTEHQSAEYGSLALIITIISVAAKELLAQFAFFCSRKSDSLTLKADGWHHRSDAISSVLILLGIIFGSRLWWIDGLLGIVVGLLIGWTAYQFTGTAISAIIGEEPGEELLKRIKEISAEVAGGSANAHHFHLHDYVTHKEITFHIRLDKNMSVEDAHNLASDIENKILGEMHIDATVHIEPEA